jgi:hypothetical protein
MKPRNELEIQMQIVAYLRKKGFFVFSVPNEAAGKLKGAAISRMAKLKAAGLTAGVSDLVAITPTNEVVFIEVKDAKGRQSKSQTDFEEIIVARGFRYILLRSLQDCQKVF